MFHRPLIPLLVVLAGGILVGHEAAGLFEGLPLFISVCLAGSLLFLLFSSPRLRIASLLLSFFLAGILIDLGGHPPSRLTEWARQRRSAVIEGTVLEPMKVQKDLARFTVRSSRIFLEGEPHAVSETLQVTVYSFLPSLHPGDRIRFPARMRPFKNFNNPGRFDYESAMMLRGISCGASVPDGRRIVPMGPGDLPPVLAVFETARRPVRDFLKTSLSPRDDALFRALILGERQGITPSLREGFNKTGLGHILAVSGLHIGLVAWVSFFLLRTLLSRSYKLALRTDIRKLAAILTCLPVIGYTSLTGFQVSSQRAMIMVLCYLFSLILGREKDVWSTLALAGLVILAVDPHALYSISFQLSFVAVIGILWLTPAFLDRVPGYASVLPADRGFLYKIGAYFLGLVAASLSATLFLLPLISSYFHRVSLVTLPANVTVVPILGLWTLPLGLLSALLLPISSHLAGLILQAGAWGLHAVMGMVRFWSEIPFASVWVVTPNGFEMGLFYMFIFLVYFSGRRAWARRGLWVLALLVFVDAGYWTYTVRFNKDLRVTFLDVGQGNAALVECPGGKRILIDGGGFPADYFDVGRMVVAPYLWHSKIRRVDYLVLSHPQADHMNGLRFIARAFHPGEFWYNGDRVDTVPFHELMGLMESKRIRIRLPRDLVPGLTVNGVRIQVLHPLPGTRVLTHVASGSRLNNNSLVVKISYGGVSFLFPGDLEREGEKVLIENAGNALESRVLLSPHHGSRHSSSRAFLERVAPGVCVISSGEGNFFGFPHPETLDRLRDVDCRVIQIRRSGAVRCVAGPNRFEITTFLGDTESDQ
jgi:competence protein ComEC